MKGRGAICCRRAVRGSRLPGERVAYGSIHRIVQRFEQCHGFAPIDIVHHASPLLTAGNSQEIVPPRSSGIAEARAAFTVLSKSASALMQKAMLRKFFAASRAADTIIRGLGQKHRFGGTFKHKKRPFFTCGQAFTRSKFAHIDEINGTRWPFSFHAAAQSLYFGARHTTETIFLTKRTKS